MRAAPLSLCSYATALVVTSVFLPAPRLLAQVPPPAPITVTSPISVGSLPPGVYLSDLPPEVQAALAAEQGGQGGQGPAAAGSGTPVDPAKQAADQKAQRRLQAFKKLFFDRRPSSILKAWSAPELKPYDPKEEKDKKGKGGAAGGANGSAPGSSSSAAPRVGAADPGAGAVGVPVVVRSMPAAPGRIVGSSRTVVTGVQMQPVGAAPTTTGAPASGAPAAGASAPSTAGGTLSAAQLQALIDGTTGDSAPAEGATPPAAAAAAAPAAPAVDLALEAKVLKREMEMLQRDVTLGRWPAVAKFFDTFAEKQRKDAYETFLKKLPRHPNKPPSRLPANLQERNRYSFQDTFEIAGMAPGGFDKKNSKLLAPLVKLSLDSGSVPEELIRQLDIEVNRKQPRIDERESALLLSALKMDEELGAFLPDATSAEEEGDREALNLLARHALAMFAKEQRSNWLEMAWKVTQAALAKGEIDKEQKEEALRRAVELAPKVREDLGPQWLAESFTSRPERGMEIIATIGGQVATGFQQKARDTKYRASTLELQKTAVEALLKEAPDLANTWRPTLGLLASGWIQEAAYSRQFSKTSSFGSYMERDSFGNIYYSNQRRGGGGQVSAIEPADLLKAQPGDEWAKQLDSALRPHFVTVSAQLWLKVNEYEKAFPFIEQLADMNPRKAKELGDEFLRVWMKSNNPNMNNRANSYMFMYGFDQRSNGIPLTRSKQERNLKELADYVQRLRDLPMESVDPALLGQAFVAAHSIAEVYRLETIEDVFGNINELDPTVLGNLLAKMRTNLATQWRVPAVQEQAKTRRSQKEMMQNVADGYQTAVTLAQEAVARVGDHWSLVTAVATLLHDQNNFYKENKPKDGGDGSSAKFSEVRKNAFKLFETAAENYGMSVEGMTRSQETDMVFTTWFYAALGASDLGAIDESMVVANSQLPLIKDALAALPDGARERHQSQFANLLFTRMSAVKPQIKQRYLEAGFAVVGEHEQTREARKVWQYYQDLLSELRLEVVVDGSTEVGTEPFGVRIDIVHTVEVARESGGFQKYATNQNDSAGSWNYGRPTENYRDKFQDALNAAISEHFELESVTYNSENMEALRGDEPGWQRTPYAYAVLKARGPQVDRIPAIKLDLDFLDTSGFTILPIGSSPVAIDAAAEPIERPFESIEVAQILDERRVDEGKVSVEIKAKAAGMVPDLETFLDFAPPGFVVDKTDDQGAQVMRFTADQDKIETERIWLIALKPEREGMRPGGFRFAKPTLEDVKATYQRYSDADLETVSAEIALRRGLPPADPWWFWAILAACSLVYIGWFFYRPTSAPVAEAEAALRMPDKVNAFSVITLLQQVRNRAKLSDAQQDQLAADIRRIEASHFASKSEGEVDLEAVATNWLKKAS
ncbi:MAG: hypothetical protein AB8H80_15765 [Planctomycetota bacterium]